MKKSLPFSHPLTTFLQGWGWQQFGRAFKFNILTQWLKSRLFNTSVLAQFSRSSCNDKELSQECYKISRVGFRCSVSFFRLLLPGGTNLGVSPDYLSKTFFYLSALPCNLATVAHFLVFTMLIPASDPLHLLFLLYISLFPQIIPNLIFSYTSGLLKYQRLKWLFIKSTH